MTTYGFRLFNLELHLKNTRAPIAFLGDDQDFRQHLIDICTQVKGQTFRGSPAGNPEDAPDPEHIKKHPVLTEIAVSGRGSAILGSFRYGRDSDFESAIPASEDDPRGESIDIAGTAPTRTYRFLIIFPAQHGSKAAMLAVESIGRACPHTPLVRWLKRFSQNYADRNDGAWFKLRSVATTDPEELHRHLTQAQAIEMHLKSARSSKARRPKPVDFTLTSKLEGVKEKALQKLADGIIAGQSEEEFATELARLVGIDPETLDFEEGWLLIDTKDVGKQRVSVGHLPEIFTYPIDTARPGDPQFLSEVKRRVVDIPGPVVAELDLDGW